MATGRLDLFIAHLPVNTVVLTLNCYDSLSELLTIPNNAIVTLQRGKIKQSVQIQIMRGRECFADFMEMNFAIAGKFQLAALRRYQLVYAQATRTLTIMPSPVSSATANITANVGGIGTLRVGYELLARLGIP